MLKNLTDFGINVSMVHKHRWKGENKMEIEIKESISVEDGNHTGTIERIEYRDEPYKYTDVIIKEDKTKFDLKYGVPTSDSAESKLMKLLSNFTDIVVGESIDPEKILKGLSVKFMTMTEEKGDKKYTRIVDGSIKPLAEDEIVK